MLHRSASRLTPAAIQVRAVSGARVAPVAAPGGRGEHARMMAHAALRRRRASGGEERAYWKACAPVAVARAARLRGEAGFARLP